MQKYDRLLQTIAWLALEDQSQQRQSYREALLVNFRVEPTHSIIGAQEGMTRVIDRVIDRDLVTMADQIWALADSSVDFTAEVISQIAAGLGGGLDDGPVRQLDDDWQCDQVNR